MRFKPTSLPTTGMGNSSVWTVYMGNTSQTNFATTTSWVPLASLQNVFTGTINPVAGEWMEVTLNSPFIWDGTSNIVIAVDENTPGYNCTANWAAFPTGTGNNRGIYYGNDATNPNPASPPTGTLSTSIAQVQIVGGPMPSCYPPTSLTVTNLTYTSATLHWTPSTFSTASGFQWEVRTSGAPGSGATGRVDNGSTTTATTAAATGFSANTSYSFYVRAICGVGDTSSWSSGSFYTGYCIPSGTSTTLGINSFSTTGGVANITNNASGVSSGGYGNFTAMAVSQQPGESINFSVTGMGTTTYHWFAWVDWNNDLDFDDVGELVLSSEATYNNALTGVLTLPVAAPAGNYRLRIRNASTGSAAACGVSTNGEAEDYTLTVLPPPSCLRPATVTTSTVTLTSATWNWDSSISAVVSGYQWEVRTSGVGGSGATGLVDNGSTTAPTTTAGTTLLAANTTYTIYVRTNCGGGDFSDWTASSSFFTGYCIPEGTDELRSITNFSTTGGYTNISNLNSGFSAGGYGDFTAQSVSASAGNTIGFTVTWPSSTYTLAIWVDWNNDFDFADVGELAFSSGTSYIATPASGNITVPAGTPIGNYRMRVRNGYLGGAPTSCGTTQYGEAEDYTFTVSPLPSCVAPSGLTATNLTATSADLSWTA
ncbi:MAG: GEVED domain-containing protein, partial [Flavobacteriales bacterium]